MHHRAIDEQALELHYDAVSPVLPVSEKENFLWLSWTMLSPCLFASFEPLRPSACPMRYPPPWRRNPEIDGAIVTADESANGRPHHIEASPMRERLHLVAKADCQKLTMEEYRD
jgi:hypothetical protein